MGSSVSLLEVGEDLFESLCTSMLLQSLLRYVVSLLVEFLVHLLTQFFVVHLMVIFALHILAQLLRQFCLEFAHRLDGGHSSLQGTQQVLLADLVHLAFYHHNVLSRSTDHDVHVGLFHLFKGRVNHILTIDASHTNL